MGEHNFIVLTYLLTRLHRAGEYIRLATRLSLMMDVVPDDNVVKSSRDGPADREDESSIECTSQHVTDLATLRTVRQKRKPHCTGETFARTRVLFLAHHSNRYYSFNTPSLMLFFINKNLG